MVLNSMSEKVFRTPKIEPLLKMHFNGFGLMRVLFFFECKLLYDYFFF